MVLFRPAATGITFDIFEKHENLQYCRNWTFSGFPLILHYFFLSEVHSHSTIDFLFQRASVSWWKIHSYMFCKGTFFVIRTKMTNFVHNMFYNLYLKKYHTKSFSCNNVALLFFTFWYLPPRNIKILKIGDGYVIAAKKVSMKYQHV